MDRTLVPAVLALLLFAAALGSWVYSWWARDRPISLFAVGFSVVFWLAGIIVIIIWRVTSDASVR